MQPYVSVVIPVYNAEKYLVQCVESLIHQKLKDIEMIFVDDGSTDHSVEIIERYQKEDQRIKLLKQKNQFAGVARNYGMSVATGKYIIFVDSDDFLDLDMLFDAYYMAEKQSADVVFFGFYIYDRVSNEETEWVMPYEKSMTISPQSLGETALTYVNPAPWNKLFLRAYVEKNGFVFQNIQNCNDVFFVLMNFLLAKKIAFIHKSYYHYRFNNAKSLQGSVAIAPLSFVSPILGIKEELEKRKMFSGTTQKSFYNLASDLIGYNLTLASNVEELRIKYQYLKDHLVPYIFDKQNDVSSGTVEHAVLCSSSYEDFLFRLLKKYEKDAIRLQGVEDLLEVSAPKSSLDYRLGEKILHFPRIIKKKLQRLSS